MKTTSMVYVIVLVHMLAPAPADAQGTPNEVAERRERCRTAAATLARASGREVVLAVDELGRCEQAGGEALGRYWRSQPQDSVVIGRLVRSSQGLRDARLLNAVLDVFVDEGAEIRLRMAALNVLASYVDHRVDRLRENPPHGDALERFTLLRSPHAGFRPGSQPFPQGHERRILGLLEQTALSSSDETVANAAQFVVRRLGRLSK